MTDTNLAPCPFCGAPASGRAIEAHTHSQMLKRMFPELPDHTGNYVIEGDCACGSGLIGGTQAEVTERWNRRAPSYQLHQATAQAAATEREACAKVAEGFAANRDWVPGSLWGNIRAEVAAAIRTRGET